MDVNKLQPDSGLQSTVTRRGKEVVEKINDPHVCSQCGAKSQRRQWKGGVCKSCRKPAGWAKASRALEKSGGGMRPVKRAPKAATTAVKNPAAGPIDLPIDLMAALQQERDRLAARLSAIDRAMEALRV